MQITLINICMRHHVILVVPPLLDYCLHVRIECKTDEEKNESRKKAAEYLVRAEQLKQWSKDQDGEWGL